MHALAVILEAPGCIALRRLTLTGSVAGNAAVLGPDDVLVDIRWSGISTGTEKLLWTGEMPIFPGMGYPLVPGYESLGRIIDAGAEAWGRIGDWVFVPGAACYTNARALFGGTARRVIVPSARAFPVAQSLGVNGVLFALAATAMHALKGGAAPDLIIGHGTLGRLLARLTIAMGAPAPTVWERNAVRREGASGYRVIASEDDDRHDYATIYDASGNADCLDQLIARLRHGGEVVMAGFYANRPSFDFAPAFRREARFRIAAEWQPADLMTARALIDSGACSLAGLVSHVRPATEARDAYPETFFAADCLKMVLDWSACA